jgi:hypothetical protein
MRTACCEVAIGYDAARQKRCLTKARKEFGEDTGALSKFSG